MGQVNAGKRRYSPPPTATSQLQPKPRTTSSEPPERWRNGSPRTRGEEGALTVVGVEAWKGRVSHPREPFFQSEGMSWLQRPPIRSKGSQPHTGPQPGLQAGREVPVTMAVGPSGDWGSVPWRLLQTQVPFERPVHYLTPTPSTGRLWGPRHKRGAGGLHCLAWAGLQGWLPPGVLTEVTVPALGPPLLQGDWHPYLSPHPARPPAIPRPSGASLPCFTAGPHPGTPEPGPGLKLSVAPAGWPGRWLTLCPGHSFRPQRVTAPHTVSPTPGRLGERKAPPEQGLPHAVPPAQQPSRCGTAGQSSQDARPAKAQLQACAQPTGGAREPSAGDREAEPPGPAGHLLHRPLCQLRATQQLHPAHGRARGGSG